MIGGGYHVLVNERLTDDVGAVAETILKDESSCGMLTPNSILMGSFVSGCICQKRVVNPGVRYVV